VLDKKLTIDEQISLHKVPCGPLTIAASGVCRQRLRPTMDALLDRLTEEIHPEYQPPEAPKDHEFGPDGKPVHKDVLAKNKKAGDTMRKGKDKKKATVEKHSPLDKDTLKLKKEKMLQEAKLKAEVKMKSKEYEEKLMGNSKLLQDPTGKIKKR
jgi:hypothetical protein